MSSSAHDSSSPSPYNPSGPGHDPAHGYGQANPYAQDQYELSDYNSAQQQQPSPLPAATGPVLSQQYFLSRVQSLHDDIKRLTQDVDQIGQLHQRALSSTDGAAKQQLEQYVTQTQIANTAIKDGIKGLERDLSELDKYQSIERDYQHKYREQIARQYRIVNPDATDEEVQQAAEADWGDEGGFQTAGNPFTDRRPLQLRTNKTGHSSSVLGNVRARHNELQRIEQTLSELAFLYQELAAIVEQQEQVIEYADTNAENTNANLEKGNEQVQKVNEHARRRRKLQWWCAGIVVLIIIAIVLGVALGVCLSSSGKC